MIVEELWLRIILGALASYRLAELISLDDGPYKIFSRFILFSGRMAAGKKSLSFWPQFASLLSCPFCVGIYTSALFGILVMVPTRAGDIFLLIMSIAGFQTFLEQFSSDRS